MSGWLNKLAVIFVFLLVLTPSAVALNGDTEAEVDVNLKVEPYAEVNPGNISGNEWYLAGDGVSDLDDLPENPAKEAPDAFKPGETRWAETKINLETNDDVQVEFQYDSGSVPLEGMEQGEFEYMVGADRGQKFDWYKVGSQENSIAVEYRDENSRPLKIRALATMPDEEWWKIKAGNYKGTIDVIVSAK